MMHRFLSIPLLTLLAACNSAEIPKDSTPLLHVSDAYELAGRAPLPETQAQEYHGMHNVFALSDEIISGSEPIGPQAFAELQAMGVKTILSVDGKVPDAGLAEQYGMRYVHSPIRYKGIEDDELLRITKTFRELEGPFYVHCFHGKHRGPAAAAVGRIVLDQAPRERAVAEMRQWCGTAEQYTGLYSTIASTAMPTDAETEGYDWDFPSARPMDGFRQSMVEIPRLHDNLELLADMDWNMDPEHPDILAVNEAQSLLSVFRQASELEEVQQKPEKFRRLWAESQEHSERLVEALQTSDMEGAFDAFEGIQARCTSCHRSYRNAR